MYPPHWTGEKLLRIKSTKFYPVYADLVVVTDPPETIYSPNQHFKVSVLMYRLYSQGVGKATAAPHGPPLPRQTLSVKVIS